MTEPSTNQPSDKKANPTGTREHSEEWGSITVEVSIDATQAILTKIVCNEDSTISVKMLNKALESMGITHGVLQNNIELHNKEFIKNKEWEGRVEIALGTAATSNIKMIYEFIDEKCEANLSADPWIINKKNISFSAINNIFNSPGIEELGSLDVTVKFLQKGEVFATQKDIASKSEGKNIYNGPISSIEEQPYTAGENVSIDDNKFKAECYGILSIEGRSISIIPPLKISEDLMKVIYVNLSQIHPVVYPSTDDINELLNLVGVKFGALEKSIRQLKKTMHSGTASKVMIVAKGNEPVDGQNAELIINRTKKLSDQDKDDNTGTIDFHELDLFFSVAEGDLVAVKKNVTEGSPGHTVLGEEIGAASGEDIKVNPKEGIRVEEKEDCLELYAETAGIVDNTGDDISITPICVINGDVNFKIGNIDIDKDLHVTGSILADFIVKAQGSAKIDGMLEPGAHLEIHGNAVVKQGIIGEDTKVLVHGNLSTSFIQDADVTVNGNLFVESHIFNAKISATGIIVVAGKGSGRMNGSIAGGSVSSCRQIYTINCGSPSNVETEFILNIDQDKIERYQQLEENIQFCSENITKIMRTIQLKTITKESIGSLLQNVAPKKKKLFVSILKKLNILVGQKGELSNKEEKLSKEIKEDIKKLTLYASKFFYGACKISIDRFTFLSREDVGPSKFKVEGGKITNGPPGEIFIPKFDGVLLTGQKE